MQIVSTAVHSVVHSGQQSIEIMHFLILYPLCRITETISQTYFSMQEIKLNLNVSTKAKITSITI